MATRTGSTSTHGTSYVGKCKSGVGWHGP
jgi:hypothetical protein